jgi:cold shock protein
VRMSSLRTYDSEDDRFEAHRSDKGAEYPRPVIVHKEDGVRLTGSIRKLKQDRGFGFIAGDDGRDHFFHWSGMEKTSRNFRDLEVQDRVSFVCVEGDKGPRAICIRVVE